MGPPRIEIIGTVCFGLAVLHTFSVKTFQHLATKHPEGSMLLHFLGEVEIVFGIWARLLVGLVALIEEGDFTEPLTVIANAPNPAGFAILRDRFGPEGISSWRLFLGALAPTLVALAALGVL